MAGLRFAQQRGRDFTLRGSGQDARAPLRGSGRLRRNVPAQGRRGRAGAEPSVPGRGRRGSRCRDRRSRGRGLVFVIRYSGFVILPGDLGGGSFGPAGFVAASAGLGFEEVGGVGLAAGSYEGVSGVELEAEPGDEGILVDGVEPEGDFGEFAGDGVEVHAEDVVVGEAHFDLLFLLGVVGVGEGEAGFLLFEAEVGFGELVDGFVEEGGGADGHFADGELEDVVGGFAGEEFLEGVFDEAAGEGFGGVVGGGFLAVAAGHAVEEAAFGVDEEALEAGVGVGDVDAFLGVELFEVGGGDEVGVDGGVVVLVAGFDFVEVLLGEEAGVAEEAFVNGAELVDAEGGVGDAAFAGVAAGAVFAEGEAADDLLEDLVAEADFFEEGRAGGVEEVAGERGEGEAVRGSGFLI